MSVRWSRLGLRQRATIAFGLVGLFAAVLLAVTTYFVARTYLLEQREESAERQAFANARLTRSALRTTGVDVADLLTTIQGESGSDVVVRFRDGWYSSSVAVGRDDIPTDLRQLIGDGHAGRQRERAPNGALRVTVGAPLAAVDGGYFEVFELGELEGTLDLLRNVLVVGAIVTSLAAAAFGRFAADRIVEPLGPVADAAERISHGDLETRLSAPGDHDLVPLIDAFNAMAESLQARIERETRFASDVSHELRSPLAALRAGIEVIERRRQELPPAIEPTFDVLAARIRSFETVVLELLEISRLDANAVSLDFEDFEVEEFVRQVLASTGASAAEVEIGDGVPTMIRADRRRFAQALGTIIDNAALYAGGLTGVSVEEAGDHLCFNLDDGGPGIDPNERKSILQRFARGEAGRRAGGGSGTGLGLALAVAQIDLHGGTIQVESAPTGGARFVVAIPHLDGKR